MKKTNKHLIGAAVLLAMGAGSLSAHRAWFVPSSTVLSGEKAWVAVDFAASNNIFHANHRGIDIDGVRVIAPDGSEVEKQNGQVGEIRSVFDIQLEKEGTYRIVNGGSGFFAMWMEGEDRKRWHGTAEEFKKEGLKDKEGLRLSQSSSTIETYVTLGAPSLDALKPKGEGIEVLFDQTHPNDLFAGEEAVFTVHLDGKPAAGLEVTIVPGQERYRNETGEVKLSTDDKGVFTYAWPQAGRYWVEISPKREPRGEGGGRNAEADADAPKLDGVPYRRRLGYVATFEVLPE
ncbi:MAG: DUF4198 domain-containing protein [Verrucomicrobiales bacterium]